MVQLPEYDAKRGGFALGKVGFDQDFGNSTIRGWVRNGPPSSSRSICFGRSTRRAQSVCSISFSKPPPVNKPWATAPMIEWVQVVLIVEASRLEPDPDRMALRLKAVDLYTQDLGAKLYTFPGIGPEPEPYLASGHTGEAGRSRALRHWTRFLLGLKYIEALGDNAPDTVYAALWQLIATRDEAFYAQPDPWAGLAANDARRPFFPRGGAERTQPAMAAFQKWAKAYAAGLPATAAVATVGMSQRAKGRRPHS